ncbi:MAG: zonular occludens toxin domain-containing protein, partial [Candidatus Aenigmatarchaeota archaeon]
MLILVEGVPGSGKSYYAVHYLYNNYNNYDVVYANIDNLQVYCENSEEFFKTKLYKKLDLLKDMKKKLMIIDEFQRIANDHIFKSDNDFYFFFEYHRHFNFDIILIVQTKLALPVRLRHLIDQYIVAQSQRFSFANRFYYLEKDVTTDAVIRRFFLKKDKNIFNLYKSAYVNQYSKTSSVLFSKWALGLGIVFGSLLAAVLVLKFSFLKTYTNSSTSQSRKLYTYNMSYQSISPTISPTGSIPGSVPGSIPGSIPGSVPGSVPGSGFVNNNNNSSSQVFNENPIRLVGYAEVYGLNKKYLIFQNEKYYFIYASKRVNESEFSSGYVSNMSDGEVSVGLNSGFLAREQAIQEVRNKPIENPR